MFSLHHVSHYSHGTRQLYATENVANEFLNLEGKKLSTSRGWAVWLRDYLESFESDYLRYALGVSLPESKD